MARTPNLNRYATPEGQSKHGAATTLHAVTGHWPGRFLGVDVGGSGTRAVMLEGGTVAPLPPGPPMNALLTPGFAGLLEEIVRAAGATAAGIGVPGLSQADRARELSELLTRRTGCPVHVTRDADTARAGAFLGGPGVVVIAGTGSAAFGWNGVTSVQVGGHGFLLGDEGSAYWIGRAAVRSALRWADQMGGSGLIHQAVTQTTGSGLEALVGQIHTHPTERERLTALAPVVAALARDDAEARQILVRAAEHLATLAEGARRRLALPTTADVASGSDTQAGAPAAPLPVAGAGGVFSAPIIWDHFAELTGATRPLAPASTGAALLAGQMHVQASA
jgi:N-acetylglucosamine kinase-like BadF-type ATPase